MRIALVDDDADYLAEASRMLARVLGGRGLKADVERFSSAEELLAVQADGAEFDLYLLDVMMPGMDGVALGRRIRERQPAVPILFFTTSRDFAVEAFAVEATDYVVKPFLADSFAKALDRAFCRLPKNKTTDLVVKGQDGLVRIPLKDILLVESAHHLQVVQTVHGQSHVVRQALQELWDKLKDDCRFVRAGRQQIVNLSHVKSFRGNKMAFANGCVVAVPRRSYNEIKAAFMRFFGS